MMFKKPMMRCVNDEELMLKTTELNSLLKEVVGSFSAHYDVKFSHFTSPRTTGTAVSLETEPFVQFMYSVIIFTGNHMIFLVQFGINKHGLQ